LPDDVIAVSSITQRALEDKLGLENVHLVPNGIDLGRIPDIIRSERAGNIVTYLGRLSPEKNLSELLYAIEYLGNIGYPNVECRIIGMGAEYDLLKKICRERNIEDRIKFYGYVSENEKYELLAESDVFVLPSSREGFSISSLEAMGCCLPVVAARSLHPESLGVFGHLTEGYNGLSYPLGNYRELAGQIGSLLSDEESRIRMGLNARETAESYSWSRIVDLYKKVIES
jgi:glycosyltransferase involved in cell wall biosynthesis